MAIARCTFSRSVGDGIGTMAAGVAFFTLLAIFPGLAAVVSLVGLFADPARLQELLVAAPDLLPPGSEQIILRQVRRLSDVAIAGEARRALSLTPYLGFAILLWSINKATKALFGALNSIRRVKEERSFLVFTLVTLAFTLGAVVFLVFAVGLVVVLPLGFVVLGFGETLMSYVDWLRWPVSMLIVAGVLAIVYRYGPSRGAGRRAWSAIVVSSALAAALWLGGSMLFSWYVSISGGFIQLYGSLAAVMGLLVWIWLSLLALLIGAELEAAITAVADRTRAQAAGRPAVLQPRLEKVGHV